MTHMTRHSLDFPDDAMRYGATAKALPYSAASVLGNSATAQGGPCSLINSRREIVHPDTFV
jgi:hypothetical protein